MPDFIQNAMQRLAAIQKEHAAQTITYRRGDNAVSLTAMPAQARYEGQNEQGIVVELVVQDFVFDAADLLMGGSAPAVVLPRDGDVIDWGGRSYLVTPLPGQRCYRTDCYAARLRVHTKEIEQGGF
jgi:hypothetical protein